jgi:anti-sigma-K factor RskA
MNIDRPDDDDVAGLAGLYALDALEGPDLDRFEAYLASHPDTRAEVDGFRDTAARLAVASSAPPPAQLRDGVLGSLSSVRQEPPRLDLARARRRRALGRRVAGAAAVVLLVFAAGFAGYALGVDGGSSEGGTPSGGEVADGVTQLLANGDAVVLDLAGDAGLSARLVYSPSERGGVVLADDLPGAPEGRTYELWTVRDGAATSAGLFDADDGRVRTTVGGEILPGDTIAVTVEPEGGSAAPTMPIVMSATV